MFGMYNGPDCSAAPFKLWVEVEGFYQLVNLIFVYVYYKRLVATGRENMKFLAFNCTLNVIHTLWLIYGNAIFWPNYKACGTELLRTPGQNINWVMGLLIVLGFVTMCKCCTVSIVFLCFAPQIYRAYRNANNPAANWTGTSADLMKNIVKKKFNPSDNTETECIICMVDY